MIVDAKGVCLILFGNHQASMIEKHMVGKTKTAALIGKAKVKEDKSPRKELSRPRHVCILISLGHSPVVS